MEEALRGHLAADAGLTALVGQSIQWAVREAPPSLALHLIDGPPDTTMKGRTGLVMARVQADCWGDRFLTAKAIGEAFVAALPARRQVIDGVMFQGCVVLDTERSGPMGDAPNILFRTRIDVRVSFSPA
jgi:hypothetical protein